ncbi:MAG: efflux RND transporter periplasmic adaptor subunit [Microscillaceae bacterium]|nr:efflux RND transporter periplasmic adaptor subunit [Microscillaceae bacterium]
MIKYTRKVGYAWSLFLLACTTQSAPQQETALATKALKANEALPVKTQTLDNQVFNYQLLLNGKLEAKQVSEVRFKQGGYVEQVYVQNGQVVQAGQVLAELSTTEADLNLQKAQNNLEARRADYRDKLMQHRLDLKNENELAPEIRQNFRIVSGLADAELQLKQAELQLQNCRLRSPVAGMVADVEVKTQNQVSTERKFCVVYSAGQLELVGEVLESEMGYLKIGQTATLTTLAKSEKTYLATLSEINPKINPNGMAKIKLTVQNPVGLLLGMNAQAKLQIPQKNALIVPKTAIVIRSGKKVVFTEENGLAKWNYVTTGLENQESVEITEGLKPGMRVIINNNLQLAHDSPVRVEK